MGLSWDYHGIVMGLSWDYHGIIMEIQPTGGTCLGEPNFHHLTVAGGETPSLTR